MKARDYHQETKNKMNYSALKALAFSQSCDSSYTTKLSRSHSIYRSAPTSSFVYLKADYDVQMQIIQTLHAIGIELPTLHVHGHPDKNTESKNLTYEAKLNIEADLLATRAWQHHYKHQEHVHYPASQCTLYINKLAVNRSYRSYLRRAYASHDTREYIRGGQNPEIKLC
eukprot:scaffold55509_cov43-Attheya_sp.AAC.1